MILREFRRTGHWPTLLAAFLYFDISFCVWYLLGPRQFPRRRPASLGDAKGIADRDPAPLRVDLPNRHGRAHGSHRAAPHMIITDDR
jgi:hypothetical protein